MPSVDDDELRKYTLVLDLDETLVHFNPQRRLYHVRPGCFQFLEELSKHYEIVVFTAATCASADFILDRLDTKCQYISHRLYRHHTTLKKNTMIKDLARLGRPLSKTLIIDNRS